MRDNRVRRVLDAQEEKAQRVEEVDPTPYLEYRMQETKRYREELEKQMDEKKEREEKVRAEKAK